jgi:hypothetical protein
MRALILAAVAATGLLAATPSQADWFGPLWFDGAYYPGGPYYNGASIVAGWGDDGFQDQHRYWGGPFWVDCRGYRPPYDSYNARTHRRCARVC